MSDLAQVLADLREEAAVLRRNGASFSVERVEAVADAVRDAAEDYLTWLSVPAACLKSGLSVRTLQRRYRELADCGLARTNARGEREFRACAIPARPDIAAAREMGRRGAA